MNTKQRLLVVDDEDTLCEALKFNLEEAGYDVDTANSAEEALSMPLEKYSLILLDIMMGDISGTQMASILKKKESTANIPIIFCTACDTEDEVVDGLELGADDYITKPYSIRTVLARIKTVLRRASGAAAGVKPEDETVSVDGIKISPRLKKCFVNDVEIKMPRKEFEILSLLLSHRGEVLSRAQILEAVWPDEVVVLDRVVDVNITRLRSKLGECGKHIVTRPGYGYCFEE